MNEPYRWNVADHAAGYDAAAEIVHPYYLEIQNAILDRIELPLDGEFLLVDLGGGSGRLAEKFLARFTRARAVVVDQSQAFLDLSARRMQSFGGRGTCLLSRLQEDWPERIPAGAMIVTSTSSIHHLEPAEKRQVYQRAYDVLAPGGRLLNGDEVRDESESVYRQAVTTWGAHMQQIVAAGLVVGPMVEMLEKWQERNVTHFGSPRFSGDDCHETIAAQLGYFRDCGFQNVGVPWQQALWALMEGTK